MAGTMLKKENITISIGEYQKDGVTKQKWRNIGEIVTMQGEDGSVYQFGSLWGAGGVVDIKIFENDQNSQQAPQQGYQQPQQPAQYQQPPQGYAPQQQPAYNQQQPVPPGQRR